jgi:outer membrane protein
MRSIILWIGVALAVLIGVCPVAGAAETRVGIVDFQRVLDESRAGKAAQATINKQGREMEAELKSKGEDLEQIKDQLEREALVMSKETREEKERDFRIKVNDFRKVQQDYAKTARELQIRAMGRIRDEVDGLARVIAEKEGYGLIIEKQEAGVLYAPANIDITDKIIQRYDAQYVDDQAKPEAKAK